MPDELVADEVLADGLATDELAALAELAAALVGTELAAFEPLYCTPPAATMVELAVVVATAGVSAVEEAP